MGGYSWRVWGAELGRWGVGMRGGQAGQSWPCGLVPLLGSHVFNLETTSCATSGCGVRDWLLRCHFLFNPFSLMNQLLGLCDTVMAYKRSQINCWLLQQDRDARFSWPASASRTLTEWPSYHAVVSGKQAQAGCVSLLIHCILAGWGARCSAASTVASTMVRQQVW